MVLRFSQKGTRWAANWEAHSNGSWLQPYALWDSGWSTCSSRRWRPTAVLRFSIEPLHRHFAYFRTASELLSKCSFGTLRPVRRPEESLFGAEVILKWLAKEPENWPTDNAGRRENSRRAEQNTIFWRLGGNRMAAKCSVCAANRLKKIKIYKLNTAYKTPSKTAFHRKYSFF